MRYHAISPYFVPLLGLSLGVFSFFFPSGHWASIFDEKNYSYLNLNYISFLLLIYFVFYCGIVLGEAVVGKSLFKNPKDFILVKNHLNLFVSPVVFCTILVLSLYLSYLLFFHPGYVLLTFTGRGALAKEMIANDEVDYATIVNFAIPVVWWSFYQYCLVIKHRSCKLLKFLLIALSAILMFLLVVMAARFAIMPLFIGIVIIYSKFFIFDDSYKNNNHLLSSIKIFILLGFVVVLLFSAIAVSRGTSGIGQLWEMILGYGPASYNRLARVLDGGLYFDYSNTGVYILPEPFFSILRAVFGLDMVGGGEVWLSEFDGVERSGLNRNFIWATQLGYVFDSLSYFSFVFFLFYGFVFGLLWRWFCNGGVFGVIFYPLFYFSIFFTFGSLYFVIFLPYYLFVCLFLIGWTMLVTLIRKYSKLSND